MDQPSGSASAVPGGWGNCARTQCRGTQTACQRSRRSLTSAQSAPYLVKPAYKLQTAKRGFNRVRRPCVCRPPTLPRCHGQRARRPDPPPWSGPFFGCNAQRRNRYKQVYIYIHAERGQFSRQRQAAGPACPDGPAAPMRRRCATTARQACRSAGVWLAWWPGGITAGAGPPG